MSSKSSDVLREARRNAYRGVILQAAEEVFAEYGYEAAQIKAIAARAGVSVGTIYSVFGSKAELFSLVLTFRLPELLELSSSFAAGATDPLDSLVRGMDAYIGYMLDHPNWLRIHVREHAWGLGPTRAAPEQLSAWRQGLALQASVLEDAMERGQVVRADPVRLARSLAAIQQVHLADWVEDGCQEPPEQVRARVGRLFRLFFCTDRTQSEAP